MTFPFAELKFSQILRSDLDTRCNVRLYRVNDGGLDPITGEQLYARVLKKQKNLMLHGVWTDEQLEERGRQEVTEWALEEFGIELPPDRLVCDL